MSLLLSLLMSLVPSELNFIQKLGIKQTFQGGAHLLEILET